MKPSIYIFAAILASLTSTGAYACQVSQAHIKGTISGNDPKDNVCYIVVTLEEVTADAHCPLRSPKLKVGKEVTLKTNLTERQCPDDEGAVSGSVISIGGDLMFTGKLPKHDDAEEENTGPKPR